MMQYPHWDANLLVVLCTVVAVAIVVLVHYEGLALISSWLAKRREVISRRNVLYHI